ncbi:MAG: SIS domain-containing protein [Oceanospirillaceae bacterium]
MKKSILGSLNESHEMLTSFMQDPTAIAAIERAAKIMICSLKSGNTIYSCGNGGSMSDAMHFAEELSGRFRNDRAALSATAISDPGHITCVANDFGYEHIFSRYLQANAKKQDCLLAISTSGSSKNVLKAAQYAKENGIQVISLTGPANTILGLAGDVDIYAGPSNYADRVQEIHIKVIHILIELIERELFPENY